MSSWYTVKSDPFLPWQEEMAPGNKQQLSPLGSLDIIHYFLRFESPKDSQRPGPQK